MKQKEVKKQMYVCPAIEIIGVDFKHPILQASGDHSTIGQGETFGNAKRGSFLEEDGEQVVSESMNTWSTAK